MPESKPICGIGAYSRMATKVEFHIDPRFERLMTTNPKMERKLRTAIHKLILEARAKVASVAETKLLNDPRKTAHAIRSTVYSEVFGANLNLLSSKKANSPGPIPPVRYRLQTETNRKGNHRGGNRRPRSSRTIQMLGYQGFDRAFVLRWTSDGTADRTTRFGSRGAIAPRGWFPPAANNALNQMADQLVKMIDEIIAKEMSGQ